jgi:hypothetical protein
MVTFSLVVGVALVAVAVLCYLLEIRVVVRLEAREEE